MPQSTSFRQLSMLCTFALACSGAPEPEHRVLDTEVLRPAHSRELDAAAELAPSLRTSMRRLAHTGGQTLYVPVFSTIYLSNDWTEGSLSVTLSVRNTDLDRPITIHRLDYHGSKGERLQPVMTEPLTLAALASRRFLVTPEDRRGGAGALFILEWSADELVTEPIVEAINVFTAGSRSFAFTSQSRVLETSADPKP